MPCCPQRRAPSWCGASLATLPSRISAASRPCRPCPRGPTGRPSGSSSGVSGCPRQARITSTSPPPTPPVVARGAADRVGGARRAAGARGGVRVRAERADGWVARLRLGEAVFGCDGPEVRARALGADRVAGARSRIDILRVRKMPPEWDRAVGRGAPDRDWAVGRGAAVEGVWVPGRPVSSARDDRSGLPDGVSALRRLVVADARSEDDVGRREVVAREGG